MRLGVRRTALALALSSPVACRDAPTSPFRFTDAAAPAGVPVALSFPRAADGARGAAITAAAASVVVTGVLSAGCPFTHAAEAGFADGALVLTATATVSNALILCAGPPGGPAFRAVTRPPARGALRVIVRERVPQQQTVGRAYAEREVARGTVTLP